ncbi:hypothetical protein Pd630_LPD10093 (plasmid) [Rhodococcus opacus PD630]|nr:hypothetical protein Pd630_LPD10093 [Rhodococcus opacus PD630]
MAVRDTKLQATGQATGRLLGTGCDAEEEAAVGVSRPRTRSAQI